MQTNGLFYTDANSRETMERKRNLTNLLEPISGNYYPVTSKIALRDINYNIEVAMITDRSHGGTSMQDGQMELMVNTSHFISKFVTFLSGLDAGKYIYIVMSGLMTYIYLYIYHI